MFIHCEENIGAVSITEKDASKEKVDEHVGELRRKYPLYTAVLERIPDMNLEEVVGVMFVADGVRY